MHRPAGELVSQADELQHLGGAQARPAVCPAQAEADVTGHVQVRVKRSFLGDVSDPATLGSEMHAGRPVSDQSPAHLDPAAVERRAAKLRDAGPELAEKVRRVYAVDRARTKADVDAGLYDGFIGDGDKRRCADVRATSPEVLGTREFGFSDPRLPELLFRYRARNWPKTLTPDEHERWQEFCRMRLTESTPLTTLTVDRYFAEIIAARVNPATTGAQQAVLDQLDAWGRDIATEFSCEPVAS